MRYWIGCLTLVLLLAAHAEAQDKKKDDTGKDGKGQKEPTEFMGKSFDQWRADLDYKKQKDPSKREAAMQAVLRFSLPKAADAMHDIIADIGRHPKKTVVDMSVRVNGIMALNTYFLHASNDKAGADATLIKDAFPIYKSSLNDPQIIVRERAVQGVAYLGPKARDLLDDVIKAARDSSTWELRKEAIPVMVQLAGKEKGPGDPKALVALKYLAENDNSYVVRTLAVKGLGIVGHETAMVELKKALLKDPSKDVRVAAVQAMVFAKKAGLIEMKRAWNDDPAKEVRLAAILAYGAAGQEDSMPELRKLLDHPDKEIRMQALNTMAQLASHIKTQPKDATFKKLELHTLEEKEPIIRLWTFALIMTALKDVDKTHIAPIVQGVDNKDMAVKSAAFQIISMAGPKAKPFALKKVLDHIDDPDLRVAGAAMETLVHMHAFETIPALRTLIADPKTRPEIKEAAENAIDHFEVLKLKEKNQKKTPDKK